MMGTPAALLSGLFYDRLMCFCTGPVYRYVLTLSSYVKSWLHLQNDATHTIF